MLFLDQTSNMYHRLTKKQNRTLFMFFGSNHHYWVYPKFKEKHVLWKNSLFLDRSSDIYHRSTKRNNFFFIISWSNHDYWVYPKFDKNHFFRGFFLFLDRFSNTYHRSKKRNKNIFHCFMTKLPLLSVSKIWEKSFFYENMFFFIDSPIYDITE